MREFKDSIGGMDDAREVSPLSADDRPSAS
jgi:hypothetical protein